MNKAIIVGNVGDKPEIKYTPAGLAICNFSVATNESYTDKQGNKQKKTEWHKIVVYNKQAESCANYLDKGGQVAVEGKIQTRSYDNKSGQKVYVTEVVAEKVQFIGGSKQDHSDDVY